ncbi:MAG: M23 family metallopeptidase [Verrucomicrobiota bacterium]|nr:M23 family metallopeptidase [Verrucomicrobiota bacterium]
MRADEPRAASNQNSHGASVETKRNAGKWFALYSALFVIGLAVILAWRLAPELTRPLPRDPAFQLPSPFFLASLPLATRFDFPLGNENGALAYNAQKFTENRHLGDDLNGIGGENSDLGDPIYCVADGRVFFTGEGGSGWGKIVIVLHALLENGKRRYVQSYYAHVQEILVHTGDSVARGQQIATVGTAEGRYLAHLHFEMREFITPFIGAGYRQNTDGWLNPSEFIAAHRH